MTDWLYGNEPFFIFQLSLFYSYVDVLNPESLENTCSMMQFEHLSPLVLHKKEVQLQILGRHTYKLRTIIIINFIGHGVQSHGFDTWHSHEFLSLKLKTRLALGPIPLPIQ